MQQKETTEMPIRNALVEYARSGLTQEDLEICEDKVLYVYNKIQPEQIAKQVLKQEVADAFRYIEKELFEKRKEIMESLDQITIRNGVDGAFEALSRLREKLIDSVSDVDEELDRACDGIHEGWTWITPPPSRGQGGRGK